MYKCEPHKHRALPSGLQHTPSVYVREDAIIGPLNQWIERLADPEVLATGQAGDPGLSARLTGLRADLHETRSKITKLIASIEAGMDPALLAPQIATRQAEKDRLERQIAAMSVDNGMSAAENQAVAHEWGGLRASLELAQAQAQRVRVAADQNGLRAGETPGQSPTPTPTNATWGLDVSEGRLAQIGHASRTSS